MTNKIIQAAQDAVFTAKCPHEWMFIRETKFGARIYICDRCGAKMTDFGENPEKLA
jgi:hypothetical protein